VNPANPALAELDNVIAGLDRVVEVLGVDLDNVHDIFFNGLFNKKYPFAIPLKITPQMAYRILEHLNTKNRPLSEYRVGRIAKEIKEGDWLINTNCIGFDVDGVLCDGQKRLTAILRANKAITTLVAFNLPTDSFLTVDLNQVRNASDVAAMAGMNDYGAVGTAINLLCRYKNNDLLSKKMPITNAIRSALIQENRSINESVPAGRAVQKIMSKALGIFCHYVFACINREDADRFFENLSTGALLPGDDPIFLLRERLTRERLARTHFPHHEIIALVFKAWNLFREGKKVRTLRWSPKAGESFPKPR